MKKIIISIFLLFIGFNLSAQTYGIKVGPTLSTMFGSDADLMGTVSFLPTPGITAGGSISWGDPIFEKYDFIDQSIGQMTIELLYFESGMRIESITTGDITIPAIENIKHHNIKLNGLSYFRLSPRFSIGGGIYTSFLLGINSTLENKSDFINAGYSDFWTVPVNDYAKNRFDLGTMIAFKYIITDNICWELRSSNGFLKYFYQEEVPNVSEDFWYDIYNYSVSSSVSYYFGKMKYKDSWRE